MKKSFLLLAFLVCTCLSALAQLPIDEKGYADSLEKVLISKLSDSLKARANYQLSQYWRINEDVKKAGMYLQRGKAYAKKYPYLQAVYYFFESDLYLYDQDKRSAAAAIAGERQLAKYSIPEAYSFRSKLWYNLAIISQVKDDEKRALDIILNKVIPLAKKSADTMLIAKYYAQAAKIFTNNDQLDKAENYFKMVIDLLKDRPTKSIIIIKTYIAAAANYNYLNKHTLAKQMLDKAKSALLPYPKSIALPEYYWTEGNYYENIENYSEALNSYNKGLFLAKELKQTYSEQALMAQKYSALKNLRRYKEALAIILKISQQEEYMATVNNRIDIYKELAIIYEKVGNMHLANTWLKRYSTSNDSLSKSKLKTDINALEIKFKTAENQRKIATLNAANEKANLSAKNSRLIIWLLSSVSLLILSALIFSVYYYRNQKMLALQNEQIKFTQAMLDGQEKERNRVAKDLHDGLGNMLAVLKFNLARFAREKPATALDDIADQVDNSVNELRRIAHDMMPEMLLNIGLEASLIDLCETVMSDQLAIEHEFIAIKNTMSQQAQVTIYRIVQELLTNVVKHAKAKNVFLQCNQNEHMFFITIEDDGSGFDAGLLNKKHGMGLNNIKNRVAYLNGKIEVIPKVNQGTSINIELNVAV